MNYLDKGGLIHLWSKIKAMIEAVTMSITTHATNMDIHVTAGSIEEINSEISGLYDIINDLKERIEMLEAGSASKTYSTLGDLDGLSWSDFDGKTWVDTIKED